LLADHNARRSYNLNPNRTGVDHHGKEDPAIKTEDDDEESEAEPPDEEPDGVQSAGVSQTTDSEGPWIEVRRSTRERHEPTRYDPSKGLAQVKEKKVRFETKEVLKDLEHCHNIMVDDDQSETIEYTRDIAGVAARYMHFQNERAMSQGTSLTQQYIVQKGLKKFGDKGKEATLKELEQLHDRECFTPIDVNELTPTEKKKAQETLMFLTEKRDGRVKGRAVYNLSLIHISEPTRHRP
jgi:hypothetical protein